MTGDELTSIHQRCGCCGADEWHERRTVSRRTVLGFATAFSLCLGRRVEAASSTTTSLKPDVEPPVTAEAQKIAARFAMASPSYWGLSAPGVLTRIDTSEKLIALTFDACGGPNGSGVDTELLDLLRRERVRATLFLNGRWIKANPKTTTQLAADPLFDLENHGWRHRPLSVSGRSAYGLSGTKSAAEVADEVLQNHRTLTEITGREPKFFRPGTAYADEVAVKIAALVGERIAGFNINADAGATSPAAAIDRTVSAAQPGALSLAHFNHPKKSTYEGFALALPRLKARGFEFVTLNDVADRLA